MRSRYLAIVVSMLSCIVSVNSWAQSCYTTEAWQHMPVRSIKLVSVGKTMTIQARVADDNSERAAGYQWICPEQAENTATLFAYPKNIAASFHMRNVFVPLDIYFFDDQGRQVNAMTMQPEPPGYGFKSRLYHSVRQFRYALEIARPQDYDLTQELSPLTLVIDSL